MLTEAFSRTRIPIGGRFGSVLLLAKWRAGRTYARRVREAVNLSACVISLRPKTSSKRTSPGKIGSPAASAEVQPAGRSALELRSKTAPLSALQPAPEGKAR